MRYRGDGSAPPSRFALLLVLAQCLAACSTPPQTRALLASAHQPTQRLVLEVPFFAQTAYQCGPAALASLLTQRGVPTEPATLVDQVFVPALQGTLQPEIAAAIRRHALLAYQSPPGDAHALARLVSMLDAGAPVLVLQQLGLGPWPQWHYAVAIGYDLEQRQIVLHSGNTARRPVDLGVFERTWARASYWSVAALPPAMLPAFAEQDPWIQGALDLEKAGQHEAAYQAYVAALGRWPDSEQARLGAGNTAFALGRYPEAAAQFYTLATASDGAAAMGWNNLAHALGQLGCTATAAAAARRGQALAPSDATIAETIRGMREMPRGGVATGQYPAWCDEWRDLEAH